jgi:hypothetical protein
LIVINRFRTSTDSTVAEASTVFSMVSIGLGGEDDSHAANAITANAAPATASSRFFIVTISLEDKGWTGTGESGRDDTGARGRRDMIRRGYLARASFGLLQSHDLPPTNV